MKNLFVCFLFYTLPLYAQNTCYEKSWTLYMHGQYEEALPVILQCIENNDKDYRLFVLQGRIQENLYRYDKAIAAYNRALQLNDENTEIKSLLATLYLKLGRTDVAINLYAQLTAAEPTVNRWKMDYAAILQSLGKTGQALELLHNVALTDSLNWVVQRDMGDCYFRLNRFDSAVICYEKSLKIYPNNRSFLQLMKINIKNREYQEAVRTGREMVKIDSTNVEVWKNMGLAYFFRDMGQNAIESFEKAVELGDTSYVTCSHLGFLYSPTDYKLGIKYLEIALKHKPEDMSVMYYLAVVYEMRGEFDKSIALIDKINETVQQYDTVRIKAEILRGYAYEQRRRYEQAVKIYTTVIKTDPSRTDIYRRIAEIYHWFLDKKKDAVYWYSQYLNKIDPKWETKSKSENYSYKFIIERIEKLKVDLFFEEEQQIKHEKSK
jgi:tetratricopeptide (TPR) repeat protein